MSALGPGHGFGGGRGSVRAIGRPDRKPPALMDPDRQRDRGRILRLFSPYRWRLAALIMLIIVASGLSMVSPFLLRAVLDKGIFGHDTTLLTELVLAMIAIAIATAALNVWQTYISNAIGQRVMHDLRAAVYRHLQRMSLAFFTRTRTGEVQNHMPRIVITTDPACESAERDVFLDERIATTDLASDHFAAQLIERIGWALLDADGHERRPIPHRAASP